MTKSTIGRGTLIRGTMRGAGDIVFDGNFEGELDVDGDIELGETAQIKSSLSGGRVVVRGAVLGSISARDSIVLEDGARVVGDLAAPRIGIRPGGLLRGHVSTSGDADDRPARAAQAARPRPAPVAAAPAKRAPAPPPSPAKVAPKAPEPKVEAKPEAKKTKGRAAPPPVMPTLQKGQKGALKKKSARG